MGPFWLYCDQLKSQQLFIIIKLAGHLFKSKDKFLLKFYATLSPVAVKDISDSLPKDVQLYYFGHDPDSNIFQAMNLITESERCSMEGPVTDHTKLANGKFNVSHHDTGIMVFFRLLFNM